MKKFIIAVVAVAVGFVQANAMSHERAQAEALFLTDKMAYELNLTNAQYDAVYEINYDYFVSLVGTSDILGIFWNRRERELEWVLTSRQYRLYLATTYFYKPVAVYNNVFRFAIYDHYAFDRLYKPVRNVHKIYHGGHAYKAPGHKYAHNDHKGHVAPPPKPDGNHKPANVVPGNGGHKPSGNLNGGGKVAPNNKPGGTTAPKVKPNNGGGKPSGNHNGNVGGGNKPAGGNTGAKASGSTARRTTSVGTSPASRASNTGRTSNATRR